MTIEEKKEIVQIIFDGNFVQEYCLNHNRLEQTLEAFKNGEKKTFQEENKMEIIDFKKVMMVIVKKIEKKDQENESN